MVRLLLTTAQTTDDGHVLCNLYPAMSENQKPFEDTILLDYIADPSKLPEKSKGHWKMFIAYMECTCLDGSPNSYHRLRTFYLMNFKKYIVNTIVKQRRIAVLGKDLSKYALTIGLSGFIILLVTWAKDYSKDKETEKKYEDFVMLVENINSQGAAISKNIEILNGLISRDIDKNNEDVIFFNKSILESNFHLKNATRELEKIENELKATGRKIDTSKNK